MSDTSTPSTVQRQFTASADFSITKDDLVAIRVADAERQIHEEKVACVATKRQAEKDLASAERDLTDGKANHARAAFGSDLQALIAALQALQPGEEIEATYSIHETKASFEAQASVDSVSTRFTRPLSAASVSSIRTLQSAIRTIQAQIKGCDEQMLDIKRKLADIPMLERQSKAAIAKAVISGDQGDTLLRLMDNVNVLGLPAPKG